MRSWRSDSFFWCRPCCAIFGCFTCSAERSEAKCRFLPVIIAAMLIPCGFARDLSLPRGFWPTAVCLTLLAGMGLKDYVIHLRPLRIRRDPDHINFRFGRGR